MNDVFSKRLKVLRTSRKMTQKDLACALGIGRTTVVEYENGNIYPTHTRLLALAKIFDVSMDYLTGTEKNVATGLNTEDKRDISKRLSELMDVLDTRTDLMFDGEIMDDQTRELLKQSLENSFNVGKLSAKTKFTPKGLQHGKDNTKD